MTSALTVPGNKDHGWALTLRLFPPMSFPSSISLSTLTQVSRPALPLPASPSGSCSGSRAAPEVSLLGTVPSLVYSTKDSFKDPGTARLSPGTAEREHCFIGSQRRLQLLNCWHVCKCLWQGLPFPTTRSPSNFGSGFSRKEIEAGESLGLSQSHGTTPEGFPGMRSPTPPCSKH